MQAILTDEFPLSKTRQVKGSRRLAREKAMQVLYACKISGTEWEKMFDHIFYRKFNFGDNEIIPGKLLTEDEIYEIEGDIPIVWTDLETDFAKTLIEKIIIQSDYVEKLITTYTEHWELDRIALIDRLLMEIAIIELLNFPEIPPKVSINEAIDIAKKYSTSKSGTFINGILDSLNIKLKEEGLIIKEGRGLVEE